MILSPLGARLIYHTIVIVGSPLAFCLITVLVVQATIARWWDAFVLRTATWWAGLSRGRTTPDDTKRSPDAANS